MKFYLLSFEIGPKIPSHRPKESKILSTNFQRRVSARFFASKPSSHIRHLHQRWLQNFITNPTIFCASKSVQEYGSNEFFVDLTSVLNDQLQHEHFSSFIISCIFSVWVCGHAKNTIALESVCEIGGMFFVILGTLTPQVFDRNDSYKSNLV